MAIQLNKGDRDQLTSILARQSYWSTESGRSDFLQEVFTDYDFLSQLDLHGSPHDSAARTILHLCKYGQIEPNHEAISLLVKAMRSRIGGSEESNFLDGLFDKYPLEGFPVPPPTNPTSPKSTRKLLTLLAILVTAVVVGIGIFLFSNRQFDDGNETVVATLTPTLSATNDAIEDARRIYLENHPVYGEMYNRASSARVNNGCGDIYGNRESGENALTLCDDEVSRFTGEWNDRSKSVGFNCSDHPNVVIELYYDAEFEGGEPVVFTCADN